MRMIMALIMLGSLIAFSQPSSSSEPIKVNHRAITVIDGDTIQIGPTVYQLAGIDAPELGQACDDDGHLWLCGLAAGYSLRKHLELEALPINCFVQSGSKPLPLASCMIGDQEISVNMLKSGYVAAVPGAPPHYAVAELSAKRASLGIWGSKFIPPWEWRKGKRLSNEHEFKASSRPVTEGPWKEIESKILHLNSEHAACVVKGAIGPKGEHFYYSPLDRDYGSISIDLKKGERFFCGDEEARKAGWRRKGELAAKRK